MAVVVPNQLIDDTVERVIEELQSYDIKARWAVGEDVKESAEQAILTNYASIVGLEFDAVFAIGCDLMLRDLSAKADMQGVWVAITRPRQQVTITYMGIVPLLDKPEFGPFKSVE